MSALTDLTDEVAKAVAAMEAAVAALGKPDDSAELTALTAQLATAQTALDAAVVAKSS